MVMFSCDTLTNSDYTSLLGMQCNWINSQRTFLEQITSGQSKVALIGCGCSIATEIAAVSSNFFNITHVSMTDGHFAG